MQASAWHGGSNTYGIRVGKPNRDKYFNPDWKTINVELDGRFHQFELTDGFWRSCPEIRDRGRPVIREWLQRHRSLNWPHGRPPKVELIPLGNGKFSLVR